MPLLRLEKKRNKTHSNHFFKSLTFSASYMLLCNKSLFHESQIISIFLPASSTSHSPRDSLLPEISATVTSGGP